MALTDNIKAYYKFDNGAITTDSVAGTYTLTNTGTVASGASGLIGYCADFGTSGTTKKLSRSDNMGLTQAAWMANFWVNFATLPGTSTPYDLFHIRNTTSSNNRLSMNLDYRNESGVYKWNLNIAGTEDKVTQTVTTGVWYMVTIGWDGTNSVVYINNSNIISTNRTTGADSGTDTNLGNFSAGGRQLFGQLDEIGFWARALTLAERTSLYNSGSGLQYPFITTNVKNINGLAYASVKSKNGLAIASIKSFNGLA